MQRTGVRARHCGWVPGVLNVAEPFSVLAFGSLPAIATGLASASRNREFVVSVASTLDVAHYYVDMHAIDCIVCAPPFGTHDDADVLSSLRERANAPIVLLTEPAYDATDIDEELYDALHCFEGGDADLPTAKLADSIRRAVRSARDDPGVSDVETDGDAAVTAGNVDADPVAAAGTDGATPVAAAGTDGADASHAGEVAGDADADGGDGAVAGEAGGDGADAGEADGDGADAGGAGGDGFVHPSVSAGSPEGVQKELQRSNVELEQFAYVAAHDLREPLRMISSYLQLLQRRYGGELDDDADEFIGYAVDGADRMRQMINDLLAYARVDRYKEAFAEVDADEAVETALSHLAVAIEESDATIEVDELPVVVGDRRQLTRLFQNLVSNAIKYAGDAPPRVRIECDLRDGPNPYYEFTVADDGIGIAPDRQDDVFAIFQSGSDDSTGIGLAICEKVVTRHGGEIWVDSTPGDGTTFHFTLPVPEEATPADARDASQSESAEAS